MTTKVIDAFEDDNAFLSNFDFSPIVYKGKAYSTAEHAYQAAKALDEEEAEGIRLSPTPGQAKRLGQLVRIRPDWEQVKVGVMEEVLRQKFAILSFRKRLLKTGEAELIEGNTWNDKIWGQVNGKGENHLGKILMKLREEYRAGTGS